MKPVKVAIGPTDGAMTEVQGEEVKEGLEVIVGEQRQELQATAPRVLLRRRDLAASGNKKVQGFSAVTL